MKYNVVEVVLLNFDYLGFIFYDKSLRKFEGKILNIFFNIKKVGVFVNEEIDVLIEKVKIY